jgi:hypothetical protein
LRQPYHECALQLYHVKPSCAPNKVSKTFRMKIGPLRRDSLEERLPFVGMGTGGGGGAASQSKTSWDTSAERLYRCWISGLATHSVLPTISCCSATCDRISGLITTAYHLGHRVQHRCRKLGAVKNVSELTSCNQALTTTFETECLLPGS